jgi:recombination protein RecT
MGTDIIIQQHADEIEQLLRQSIGDLAEVCTSGITPEHALQAAVLCVYKTPDLCKCDRTSLKVAVIQAAAMGLDLNPALGEAYLIPRWNKNIKALEAQMQPGYRGLAKLARAAAGLNYIQAEIVRQRDVFEAKRCPDWEIEHVPVWGSAGGAVTHVYAVAKLPTGEYQIAVLTRDEVEEIRRRSQFPDSGPWKSDWNEMGKKTAVKRLVKLLPTSGGAVAVRALAAAVEADNREYEDGPAEHHAVNHGNDTGHGSGAYADAETVIAYAKWVAALVEEMNQRWADRHAADPRGVPSEIMTTWQLSGHLLKWSRAQGLVNAPEQVRAGQRDKFAAVAWSRFGGEFESEAREYGRAKWREEAAKLRAIEAPTREPGSDDENMPSADEEAALDAMAAKNPA